jgi:chromosome segregation ATPase
VKGENVMGDAASETEGAMRIAHLEAEREKFLAEAEKARYEQRAFRNPQTWILILGAIAGFGTAAFKWLESGLASERSALAVERAELSLQEKTRDLTGKESELQEVRQRLTRAAQDLADKTTAIGVAETALTKCKTTFEKTSAALMAAQTELEKTKQQTDAQKALVSQVNAARGEAAKTSAEGAHASQELSRVKRLPEGMTKDELIRSITDPSEIDSGSYEKWRKDTLPGMRP